MFTKVAKEGNEKKKFIIIIIKICCSAMDHTATTMIFGLFLCCIIHTHTPQNSRGYKIEIEQD